MNIQTQFNIGDQVYVFNRLDSIKKEKITSIVIEGKKSKPLEIIYIFSEGGEEDRQASQDQCFASIEDLKKNIISRIDSIKDPDDPKKSK